jgi:hypothetical protein
MVSSGIDFVIFDQTNHVSRTDICRSIQTLAALKGVKVAHARDCNDGGINYSGERIDNVLYNESVLYEPFGVNNYLKVDGKYLMVLYDIASAYEKELTRTDPIFQKFTYVSADGYAPGRELWGWQLRTEGAVPSKRGMYVSGSSTVANVSGYTSEMWMTSLNYLDYNFLLAKKQNPNYLIVGSWDDMAERNNWANIISTNSRNHTYNIQGVNDPESFGNRVRQWLTSKPTVIAGGSIQDGAYQVVSVVSGHTIRPEGVITTKGAVTGFHFSNASAYLAGSNLVQNTFIDEIHHHLWFYHLGNNEYTIIPAYTALRLTANATNDNITMETPSAANNQVWTAILNANGSYSFQNKMTNKFLGITAPQVLNSRILQEINATSTSIQWNIEAKNIIPTDDSDCNSIIAQAVTTVDNWTYYAAPNSTDYLFAIEHQPQGGNNANFTAYIKLAKNCDNTSFRQTHLINKDAIFAAGYYWNINLITGNLNGFINIRFFPNNDINSTLDTESNSFYLTSGASHQSPPIYFKTDGILQLPNDLRFDGKGINIKFSPLFVSASGIFNGKNYDQFNGISNINNTGGGMLKRVINMPTDSSLPSELLRGSLRYNNVLHRFEGHNGTDWVPLH